MYFCHVFSGISRSEESNGENIESFFNKKGLGLTKDFSESSQIDYMPSRLGE